MRRDTIEERQDSRSREQVDTLAGPRGEDFKVQLQLEIQSKSSPRLKAGLALLYV